MSDAAPKAKTSGRYHELAADFEVLANAARLELLHELTTPRYGEEIAETLGVTRQAASKHIQRLLERGFLRALHGRRARGPVVEYQVVPQRFFALGHALGELSRLETAGGPLVRRPDPTIQLDGSPAPTAPAPTEPTYHLLVLHTATMGERVGLEPQQSRWTIGRDDEREVRLPHDPYVSGKHAQIQRTATGLDVVDLYSANGTFLNLVQLPRGGRAPLRNGDVLTIGRTNLVLQAPD